MNDDVRGLRLTKLLDVVVVEVVGIVEADIGGAEAVAASFNLAATSLRRRLLFRPALITKRARFCQK